MSRKIKDGWHTIYGWDFLVKDGRIHHAVMDGIRYAAYRPQYINDWLGRRQDGWTNCSGMTYSAFRAAWQRGEITIIEG